MSWSLRFLVVAAMGVLFILTGCSSGKDSPAKQKARSHYLLGVSALGENNPSQALQELLQAEEIDSDDAEVQAALARPICRNAPTSSPSSTGCGRSP
jgi:Tfp pilus assembly protein PilF